MSKCKISECSDLFTGFPLSTKDFTVNGGSKVIQLRDVDKDGITILGLKRSNITVSNKNKYVRQGDVLFKSRGHSLEAYALMDNPEKSIVTNGFIVLRPNQKVLPRYLAWVLNNVGFDKLTQQTHMIKSVSIRDLRNLEIPMPEMAQQNKIIEISDEIDKGKELAAHYFHDAEKYLRGSVFNQ